MSGAADKLLVALALAASAGYAGYALGPKSLKRWLFASAARLLGRIAPPLAAWAAARAATLASAAGSCGGCGNCASNPGAGGAPPAAEVRIPVSSIARR